ncbi:MAG: hypothetical protein LBQ27_01130, partial [Clostridiales bacterium]|nr:hypothetical protein [Clostridiales bacterium]
MKTKSKNRFVKFLKASAVLCLVAVQFFGIYAIAVTAAGVTITINPNDTYQTLEGFGASSSWTFQLLGKEDDASIQKAADMLYGDDGLALSIFRYNIGAGSSEAIFDNVFPYNTGWFSQSRRAESFFISE